MQETTFEESPSMMIFLICCECTSCTPMKAAKESLDSAAYEFGYHKLYGSIV